MIIRKSKLPVLKEFEIPDPIPMHPPGYFNDIYDDEYVKESNMLARHSVQRVVK